MYIQGRGIMIDRTLRGDHGAAQRDMKQWLSGSYGTHEWTPKATGPESGVTLVRRMGRRDGEFFEPPMGESWVVFPPKDKPNLKVAERLVTPSIYHTRADTVQGGPTLREEICQFGRAK